MHSNFAAGCDDWHTQAPGHRVHATRAEDPRRHNAGTEQEARR